MFMNLPTLAELADDAACSVSDLLSDNELARFQQMSDADKVIYRYLHADCDDVALALHVITGWDVRAVSSKGMPIHRLVSDPDGKLLDIGGWTTLAELQTRYKAKRLDITPAGQGDLQCHSTISDDDDMAAAVATLLRSEREPFLSELRDRIESYAQTIGLSTSPRPASRP